MIEQDAREFYKELKPGERFASALFPSFVYEKKNDEEFFDIADPDYTIESTFIYATDNLSKKD